MRTVLSFLFCQQYIPVKSDWTLLVIACSLTSASLAPSVLWRVLMSHYNTYFPVHLFVPLDQIEPIPQAKETLCWLICMPKHECHLPAPFVWLALPIEKHRVSRYSQGLDQRLHRLFWYYYRGQYHQWGDLASVRLMSWWTWGMYVIIALW